MLVSIEANVDEESALLHGHSTESPTGSCRRKLLLIARTLLHLGCAAYCLYLIWLVVYLKDSPYYWFIASIPFVFNVLFPLMVIAKNTSGILKNNIPFIPGILDLYSFQYNKWLDQWSVNLINSLFHVSSASVVLTLMTCFTMLTRLAYYHRQPDEFIGPRFIILSLQGSIILISLDFFLQREGKLEIVLNDKDALTRMLLDFVDVFNMVEILSANECFGVGSFVSEETSTENAIQAFCTISFTIVWVSLDIIPLQDEPEDHHLAEEQRRSRTSMEMLYSKIIAFSVLYQNLPFFVIRIVVWAQYKLYSLGFLVKNFIAIVIFIAVWRGGGKLHIAGCRLH